MNGSSTEVALLRFIEKCGLNYETIREQREVLSKFPFTSSRKRMSVIVKNSEGRAQLVVKGASELVLECCDRIHLFTNEIVYLDDNYKTQCLAAIDSMAKDALRTLVLAYKDIGTHESYFLSLFTYIISLHPLQISATKTKKAFFPLRKQV